MDFSPGANEWLRNTACTTPEVVLHVLVSIIQPVFRSNLFLAFWLTSLPGFLFIIIDNIPLLPTPILQVVSMSGLLDRWHASPRSTTILRDQPLTIGALDHLIYLPYWLYLHLKYYAKQHPIIFAVLVLPGILGTDTNLKKLHAKRRQESADSQISRVIFHSNVSMCRLLRPRLYDIPGTRSLPLCALMDRFINGDIEFPDAAGYLPRLMMGELKFDGWTLQIDLYPWWWRKMCWQYCVSYDCPNIVDQRFTAYCIHNPKPHINPRPRIPEGAHGNSRYLDRVSLTQLCPFIRTMQSSAPRGSSALLYFTTRGPLLHPSMLFWSTFFAFAELPFSPRSHSLAKRTKTWKRRKAMRLIELVKTSYGHTDMPLYITKDQILLLLTSGPSPFVVDSVEDISCGRTDELDGYACMLQDRIRKHLPPLSTEEKKAWKEEQFVATWQAALMRVGLLTRWAVVLRKQ